MTPAAKAAVEVVDVLADMVPDLLAAKYDDLVATCTSIIAQATLDACEQERERIVRAVDRMAPANFQIGTIGRYVREATARATDMPIETASERGLALAAARAEGIATGLRMAAAEAERRAEVNAMACSCARGSAASGMYGAQLESEAIAAWCEAKAEEVER